jgi:hypothetical protein
METHDKSENDRGAWVALCSHPTCTGNDTETSRVISSVGAGKLHKWLHM